MDTKGAAYLEVIASITSPVILRQKEATIHLGLYTNCQSRHNVKRVSVSRDVLGFA
jgi:hypothetical protein